VIPVRDDTATTTCGSCGRLLERLGRQRFCSTTCRQAAWRRKRSAPTQPTVGKADTVYACDDCDTRYLGQQRCAECNRWCRRIGPGGPCPCCHEPVAIADLFTDDQLNPPLATKRRR
jgi:hypothetical protein